MLASGLLLAMAWRLLDHQPMYDELLHVFAARGLRDHGVPAIVDGIYERAFWFTWIVALALEHLGDSLVAARVPSLVASVGLVMVTTLWVSRRVGLLAGAAAAAVLIVLPETIELAVFARFYSLHALLVMSAAIAAYEATCVPRTRTSRGLLGAGAVVLLLLAVRLQVTTLIALGAIVGGVGAVLLLDHRHAVAGLVRRHPIGVGVGILLVLAGGGFLLSHLGMLTMFRSAPLWVTYAADRPHYYLVILARATPLLWPIFPAAAVVAFAWERRLTVFFVTAFALALLTHSAAAAKSMRYIYYALPFMAVVFGMALSGLYAFAGRVRPPAFVGGTAAPWMLLLVGLVAALSQEGQNAARRVVGSGANRNYGGETDWISAVPVLQPLVTTADRVVTSNSMKALYYFGRYDYELNASIVLETATRAEFGLDERTGRQAIGTAESVRKVLDMPGRALIVLEEEKIIDSTGVSPAALETIVARCAEVSVPPAAGIRAWSCPAPAGRP
jgi:hypothetical protein